MVRTSGRFWRLTATIERIFVNVLLSWNYPPTLLGYSSRRARSRSCAYRGRPVVPLSRPFRAEYSCARMMSCIMVTQLRCAAYIIVCCPMYLSAVTDYVISLTAPHVRVCAMFRRISGYLATLVVFKYTTAKLFWWYWHLRRYPAGYYHMISANKFDSGPIFIMELPADIINLFITATPVAFLCVSKTTRGAASAAISGRIRLQSGTALYNGNIFTLRREHNCVMTDVAANGYALCDIMYNGVPCECSRPCTTPKSTWLTYKLFGPRIHHREVILVILALAAVSGRVLPCGFGE